MRPIPSEPLFGEGGRRCDGRKLLLSHSGALCRIQQGLRSRRPQQDPRGLRILLLWSLVARAAHTPLFGRNDLKDHASLLDRCVVGYPDGRARDGRGMQAVRAQCGEERGVVAAGAPPLGGVSDQRTRRPDGCIPAKQR